MNYPSLMLALVWWGSVSTAIQDFNFNFNTTLFDPNKTDICKNRSEDFKAHVGDRCHSIASWRRNHSTEFCAEYWFYNQKTLDEDLRDSTQRAVVQYCNGTSSFIPCVKCFNLATEPLWNKRLCPEYNRTTHVVECFRKYTNNAFNWSREVIFNNVNITKVVSRVSPPYDKCDEYFYEKLYFPDEKDIKFPIDINQFSSETNEEFTVMLSFFMNAFEDNNPEGTTVNETKYAYGFRCEDFKYRQYLSRYKYEVDPIYGIIHISVKNNYKNIRSDMCHNATECMSCFLEADEKFFYLLLLFVYKLEHLFETFDQVYTMYNKCMQSYNISEEYVAILNDSHTGMDKVDVRNCSHEIRDMYDFLRDNPGYLNTNNQTLNNVYIGVTKFNLYSALGYSARHSANTCEVITESLMDCIYLATKKLIEATKGPISRREEEEALETFTDDQMFCGDYRYGDNFVFPGDLID